MKHYYTENDDLISEPEQFIFNYRGKTLTFVSDNGVFSKKNDWLWIKGFVGND